MPPPRPVNAFSLIGVPRTRSGKASLQPAGGAVGAAVEAVHVLAHDDDARRRSPSGGPSRAATASMNFCSASSPVNVVAVGDRRVRRTRSRSPRTPTSTKRRVGPLARLDPALAGLAAGQRLEQHVADLGHQRLGRGDRRASTSPLRRGCRAARGGRDSWSIGSRCAPGLLLLLGAVAEGAAREGAVLVEVAVGVGLDHRRAVAGAHVRQRLAAWRGGRPAGPCRRPSSWRMPKPGPRAGQPGLAGGLVRRWWRRRTGCSR